MYVIGAPVAPASSSVVHKSSPVALSNALNCFPPKPGGVPTVI
jgi:hypothetical protein